jgi:LemA protein
VDVHLQQRYDLIPNLVQIVQAYARHEQKTLEDLAALRSKAVAGGRAARVQAEGEAVAGLTRVFALAESYPDLKANANFLQLANQITAIEDKIAHARSFSNEAVKEYNVRTAVFPAGLIASLCGFRAYPLFAADLDERSVPRLQMGAKLG